MALTNEEASIALGMIARGDNKHDIAAFFGVNQARIKEVEDGSHGVSAAPSDRLPPKGPIGPKARRMRSVLDKALAAAETGDLELVKALIGTAKGIYDKNTA